MYFFIKNPLFHTGQATALRGSCFYIGKTASLALPGDAVTARKQHLRISVATYLLSSRFSISAYHL